MYSSNVSLHDGILPSLILSLSKDERGDKLSVTLRRRSSFEKPSS